jgi:predicted nucleic acid-binding protein
MAGLTMELILDTNVALAWLLFDDPEMHLIQTELSAGRWRWCATAAMRDEFIHVLSYPALEKHQNSVRTKASLMACWDHWVHVLTDHHDTNPSETPPIPRLRCTDPDDQGFIDLALARQATLITRDKALLALARRAARHRTPVMTPASWSPTFPVATP